MNLIKIYLFVFTASIFFCISCGSPISNQKASGISNPESSQAVLTGCPESFPYEFSSQSLCARMEWFDYEGSSIDLPVYYEDYNLTWKRPVHAKIYFMDKLTFKPIDPTDKKDVNLFSVKLWMPTHGHGSEKPLVKKVEGRLGEYLVEELYFIMKSDSENPWQVRLLLKTQDSEEAYNEAEDTDVVDSVIIPFYKLDVR